MSRVLVLGADGQLGRCLRLCEPEGQEILYAGRKECDIGRRAELQAVLARVVPDYVINCAAHTQLDRAESERQAAHRLNAEAPGWMAEALAAQRRPVAPRLIQVSTGYVFSGPGPGSGARPWRPEDPPSPCCFYGETKLAGERLVRERLPEDSAVVRATWLYSAFGVNFVLTMLRLMAERDGLRLVMDQRGSPTWALPLARALWRLTEVFAPGIHHWADVGDASWHEFAEAIRQEALRLSLLPKAATLVAIPASDYPTPATRPSYSVLDGAGLAALTGLPQVPWRTHLAQMLQGLGH